MQNLKDHVNEVLGYERPVHCIPMGVSADQINNVSPLDTGYKEQYLNSSKIKIVSCRYYRYNQCA